MDVTPEHQHVGSDGMCYFPYCEQWNQGSNVVGLVQVMQEAFSQHPPVTARAPGAAQMAPGAAVAAPAPALVSASARTAINVGGRMIPGYTNAQRAVTDATAAVQRWPTLKLEAGLYSAQHPLCPAC